VKADIAVIGGGIAGASAAAELAAGASVVLLEREARCGLHATGRSAASFTEAYGHTLIRRLARASRPFLETPPDGFSAVPLLRPRGMVTVARADQVARLAADLAEAQALVPEIRPIPVDEVEALVPILRPGHFAAAFIEPGQREIDVDALHQGFLRLARGRGAQVLTGAGVEAIARDGPGWRIATAAGPVQAGVIVNAAGAWADAVAGLAGVAPLGLTPYRRTAFQVAVPEGLASAGWPMINDVDEAFYFKPDAGRLFVSPGDATPSAPMDAWPEEMDIAIGVDRLEAATTLRVRRVLHSWAGLRTFAPDRVPVAGMDDAAAPGFFWLAGQGGYGIKTAAALARITAGLILHGAFPDDLAAAGIDPAALSPARLRA
jgi:D-arginine dehydrogenase